MEAQDYSLVLTKRLDKESCLKDWVMRTLSQWRPSEIAESDAKALASHAEIEYDNQRPSREVALVRSCQ